MTPMKWFFSFLKKYRRLMIVGILLTTAVSALSVVNPYISGQIVDQVISGGKYDRLMPFIGCLIGVTIVMGVLRFLFQVAFETASQGVLYDMRDKVYRKLLEEDFAFYNKKRTGDLMSRQTGDMDAIRHFVAYVVYMVYQSVLMFVFALLMIFTVNTKLALAMLVVLPFTAFATCRQTKEVRPAFKRNRDCFSSLNAFVQENVSGNRVVKAFAKEDFEIEKFNKENDKFRAAQIDASKIWMKYVPIFEVLSYALTIILILYGGYMVIQGEITLGQLVTVNGYLWMLNNPLRQAGWLVNDISNFTTSVEKIYATYSEEPHVKTPVSGVVKKHLKGEIEFKNVSYRADDEDIVMDVNFKVKPGQTVGIIGSTGAGKTTITNLINRFYDIQDGKIRYDGININKIKKADLRHSLGMVLQDTHLFTASVKDNIRYGKLDATDEEVIEAAKLANADSFIERLPQGYDTVLTGDGANLSQGQRQLLSIARAAIADPPVLILDEATSSIDTRTEKIVQEGMDRLMHGRTTFVIAHRLSTIKNSDCIMVLEQGRIIERGSHDDLIEEQGRYYQLYTGNKA